MSLIKKLIQRLLDSRTTPEEAGHNAMPINIANATNLTMDVGAEGSYTAPADGYLSLMVEPGGNINLWGQILPISSFPIQNVQGKLFVPMAKGMEVRYYINGTVSLAKFLKTIGGGYLVLKNALLQGGGLCLNSLSSSLRRSSCRVRRNGSEVKVFSQTQIPEQRSLLTTLRLNFIRLQVMDGLRSAETDHRSMSALPESWERVALTLKVISELQLRFGRGIPLVSIARRTISNRLRQNSFPAKGQRSTSLVGGVSC